MSGTGGMEFPPIPLITAGEFDTIPAGSPPYGPDPNDPSAYYVNSFPATAMEYGSERFAPIVFGCTPDFAVTGPNVGSTSLRCCCQYPPDAIRQAILV